MVLIQEAGVQSRLSVASSTPLPDTRPESESDSQIAPGGEDDVTNRVLKGEF